MKGKLFFLTILVALFIGFVAVRYFWLDKQNNFGRLKVVSSPTATIFVNNLAIGKTPFEDKYKVGEYILKLIPEGTATETASWQGKIKINKNVLTFVDMELGSSDISTAGETFTVTKSDKKLKKDRGEIEVETEPQGAIVYLDNDEKGVAPLLLSDVVEDNHELSVFMPGFFRRTQKINVTDGYKITAFFKLAIDKSQKLTPSKTPETGKESTESASLEKKFVLIKDTPTGWLRVREGPSLSASESAKVNPGDKFELLGEQEGWYKIKYDDREGWVSSAYTELVEE